MKHFLLGAMLWLSCLTLVSCGGNQTDELTGGQAAETSGLATVRVAVAWPTGRVIPPDTTEVVVYVSGGEMRTVVEEQLTRPTGVSSVTVAELPVPAGDDRLVAAIAINNAGEVLAVGNYHLARLEAGGIAEARITLEPVPESFPAGVEPRSIETAAQAGRSGSQPAEGEIVLAGLRIGNQPPLTALTAPDFRVLCRVNSRWVCLPVRGFDNLSDGSAVDQDIVFLLDTTGSMGEEIAGVRDSVRLFASTLADSGRNVRLAAVTFGDYHAGDEVERRPALDFIDDAEAFRRFVADLDADGGGDSPEDALDAVLYAAETLSWREHSQRIMILITDADMHQAGDGTSFTSATLDTVVAALAGRYAVYVVSPNLPVRSAGKGVMPANGPPRGRQLVDDPTEPADNNPDGARELVVNGPAASGTITAGDVDWFRFHAVAGTGYVIATALPSGGDSVLELYTGDGSRHLMTDDDGGPDRASLLRFEAARSEAYLVRVKPYGSSQFAYTLTLTEYVEDIEGRSIPAKLLARRTSGAWIEMPVDGIVDLGRLGITELVNAGYRLRYPLLWVGRNLDRQQRLKIEVRSGDARGFVEVNATF